MHKKILGILLLSTLLLSLTGCMKIYETFTVNPDGTITGTATTYLDKEFADSHGQTPEPGTKVETLSDGRQYYAETETQNYTATELSGDNSNVFFDKDIFYYWVGLDKKDTDIGQGLTYGLYLKMTINLSDAIVDTNANVTDETSGNTACFDTNSTTDVWYAFTARGKQIFDGDKTAPIVAGVKNNKYYKTMPKITYSDNILVDTNSFKLNGLQVTPVTSSSGYDWYATVNGVLKSAKKEGKNVFTVSDIKGNTTSVTFYLDTKAPVIKGIKNNKSYKKKAIIYIKDKQLLSKVTDNKKKVKLTKKSLVKKGKYKGYYKITIKKKGKHTIAAYDKAGNKKTMKITIQ